MNVSNAPTHTPLAKPSTDKQFQGRIAEQRSLFGLPTFALGPVWIPVKLEWIFPSKVAVSTSALKPPSTASQSLPSASQAPFRAADHLPAGALLSGNRGEKPGPRFETSDLAAIHAHELVGNETLARNQEFGGLIMVNAAGKYRTTNPVAGYETSVDVGAGLPADGTGNPLIPQGFKLAGMYHSHPVKDTGTLDSQTTRDSNFYSHADLRASVLLAIDSYLYLPDGAILKFEPSRIPADSPLMQLLKADGEVGALFDQQISPGERVQILASVGAISVIQPGRRWVTPGVVPAG